MCSHSTAAPKSPFVSTRACFAASHAASALVSMPTVWSATASGADLPLSSSPDGLGPRGCSHVSSVQEQDKPLVALNAPGVSSIFDSLLSVVS